MQLSVTINLGDTILQTYYYIPDPTTFKHYKNQFVRSIENSNVVISMETLDLMGKITALFSFPDKECFSSINIKFKCVWVEYRKK